ncbi:MAG: hypothetical protein Q9M39_00870 [Sulfurovum sp.]|nr:hypothetical protein [Sulfurovum sp.]
MSCGDENLEDLFIKKASSSSEVEKYAIVNACLYVQKNKIGDTKIHTKNYMNLYFPIKMN